MTFTRVPCQPVLPAATQLFLDLAGIAAAFPIVNDDGTQTQSILANDPSRPGQLLVQVTDNSAPNTRNTVLDFGVGSGSITSTDGGEAQLSWFAAPSGTIRASIQWRLSGNDALTVQRTATTIQIGVMGAAPVARQVVTGSRGGNAALASLLTAMAAFGWITDNTTP